MRKINVGDRVTFRAAVRDGAPTLTRVVKEVDPDGKVVVRAHGWSAFIVRPSEIKAVIPRNSN